MYARVLDEGINDVWILRVTVARITKASLRQDVAVSKRCRTKNPPCIDGGPTKETALATTEHHTRCPKFCSSGAVKKIVGPILSADTYSALLAGNDEVGGCAEIKIALIGVRFARTKYPGET